MSDDTSWRYCPQCGETKPADHFYADRKKRRHKCRECTRAQMRKRYADELEFVQAYKLERGCVDCGFKGHPAALEFDHLPGREKKFNISQRIAAAVDREALLAEMAKCEVVCANCHRVRTFTRADHGAWKDLRRKGISAPGHPVTPPPFEQLTLEV
jgi:hypothetical protein